MRIIFILAILFALGCTQTIKLGYVWDKNTEPDMSHCDLFTLTFNDSTTFYQLLEWPADTSVCCVKIDSALHYPHLLATIAHIHDSPIDTVLFEFTHDQEQKYLRAYLVAYDSLRNGSFIATSWNVVFIGDRESPARPNQKQIVKFP